MTKLALHIIPHCMLYGAMVPLQHLFLVLCGLSALLVGLGLQVESCLSQEGMLHGMLYMTSSQSLHACSQKHDDDAGSRQGNAHRVRAVV